MELTVRLARWPVVTLLAILCATSGTAQSKVIALTTVTIVDVNGGPPRVATVIVENGRITGLEGGQRGQVPAGATVVDGRGKYLIPGLWDMHVHVGAHAEGVKVLPRLVAHGITGVRDMASPPDDILRLRRESADGTLLGPEIVAAGPILQRPLPFATPPLVRTVTDAEAGEVVDELQAKRVDFIKDQHYGPRACPRP